MPQPPGLAIVAVPFAPWFAALTLAVQFVSHVLLWAVQLFAARVVTLQASLVEPMRTFAVFVAPKVPLVNRTASVCPLVIAPPRERIDDWLNSIIVQNKARTRDSPSGEFFVDTLHGEILMRRHRRIFRPAFLLSL